MYPHLPYSNEHIRNYQVEIEKTIAQINRYNPQNPKSLKIQEQLEKLVGQVCKEKLFIYPQKPVRELYSTMRVLAHKIKFFPGESFWENLDPQVQHELQVAIVSDPWLHYKQTMRLVKNLVEMINRGERSSLKPEIEKLVHQCSQERFSQYSQKELETLCESLYHLAKTIKSSQYQDVWKEVGEEAKALFNAFTEFHYSKNHFLSLYEKIVKLTDKVSANKNVSIKGVEKLILEVSSHNFSLFSSEEQISLFRAFYRLARHIKLRKDLWEKLDQNLQQDLHQFTPFFELPQQANSYNRISYVNPERVQMEDGVILNLSEGVNLKYIYRYLNGDYLVDVYINQMGYIEEFKALADFLIDHPKSLDKLKEFFPIKQMIRKYYKGNPDQKECLAAQILTVVDRYRKQLLKLFDLPVDNVLKISEEGFWEIRKKYKAYPDELDSNAGYIDDVLSWLNAEIKYGVYFLGPTEEASTQRFCCYDEDRRYFFPIERNNIPTFIEENIEVRYQAFLKSFMENFDKQYSDELRRKTEFLPQLDYSNSLLQLIDTESLLSSIDGNNLRLYGWLYASAEHNQTEAPVAFALKMLSSLPKQKNIELHSHVRKEEKVQANDQVDNFTEDQMKMLVELYSELHIFYRDLPAEMPLEEKFKALQKILELEEKDQQSEMTPFPGLKASRDWPLLCGFAISKAKKRGCENILSGFIDKLALVCNKFDKEVVQEPIAFLHLLEWELYIHKLSLLKDELTSNLYTQLFLSYHSLPVKMAFDKKVVFLHEMAVELIKAIEQALDSHFFDEEIKAGLPSLPVTFGHHFMRIYGEEFLNGFIENLKRVCNQLEKHDLQNQIAFLQTLRMNVSEGTRKKYLKKCNTLLHGILHQGYLEQNGFVEPII